MTQNMVLSQPTSQDSQRSWEDTTRSELILIH